jgi:hypothetical protein
MWGVLHETDRNLRIMQLERDMVDIKAENQYIKAENEALFDANKHQKANSRIYAARSHHLLISSLKMYRNFHDPSDVSVHIIPTQIIFFLIKYK